MDERYLTVREVSLLKGCSKRSIQHLIERGNLTAIEITGRSEGQGGVTYCVPLSSLEESLQLKYLKREKSGINRSETAPLIKKPTSGEYSEEDSSEYEILSAEEREEIAVWKQILDEWHMHRNSSSAPKEQADEDFVSLCSIKYPLYGIKRRTLYRKQKALSEGGEIALLDKRGKHGKHNRKMTACVWDIFEAFYLDESRKSVSLCVTLTMLELERLQSEGAITQIPEVPALSTFTREVSKIPMPFIEYFRHGRMSFISKCSPYIKRMYEGLHANAIWVADNHTFDIMLYNGEKTLRVYLTAFMDVRTRKFTGWCVTDRPCADATVYALKRGIEQNGVPDMLYTDNGREFLFHDFGGNGFRHKRKQTEEIKPPSMLTELGVKFTTALPTNARAKGVERAFKTVKETFSKLFEAYAA